MDNHSNFPHPNQFLSAKDLERFTGMTQRFWESRRMTGDTPPFIRLSAKAVRYRWGDVQEWLEKRLRTSTSDQGGHTNDGK
jgi:predicted DNA-binding transcriptional regulator AlpA